MRNERAASGTVKRGGYNAFVVAAAPWAGLAAVCASITACGSIEVSGTTEPQGNKWQQVTCVVHRTECLGFVEDDVVKLDGRDVRCPDGTNANEPNNLVDNGPFPATICYQTPNGGTLDQQKADAQKACDSYCASSFGGLYPLGSIATTGGKVTCQSTQQTESIKDEIAGQCSKTMTSNGKTTLALCTLFGRACNGRATAADTTSFCTSMPPVASGQDLSTCFDSTLTTAESVCQNMFQWETKPTGAVDSSDQFAFVNVAQPVPNASVEDCQAKIPTTAAFGFAGAMGALTMSGTTAPLTAKSGSMRIGTVCDSEEFCTTTIDSMRILLADVTIAGLTLHNPEANLISPANLDFDSPTIQPNGLKLALEGDILGIGRARAVFSNPQVLTVSTTATTASLSGPFSLTVNTSLVGGATVTGNVAISASTTSPNATCGDATPLQQLLGFESTAYWSSPQIAPALTSSLKTQGCFGLEVGGGNFRTVNSTKFATPLPGTTGTLALDVFNPPNPPNPFWLGAVQMYLTCPSANFNNQYIGQVDLTGKPLNKFSTLLFPIPGPIKTVLQGSHPDCFFSIGVNNNQTPKPPVLDNLRFK